MSNEPVPSTTASDAFNSIRHGLTARTIVIPGLEDHAAWVKLRDGIVASLEPEGELETEFAVCIAECAWRRRRVARHESQLVDVERRRDSARDDWDERKKELAAGDTPRPDPGSPEYIESLRQAARSFYGDLSAGLAIDSAIRAERVLPSRDDVERLMRYEAHITRQEYQALHELQALQARRRGEPAPLARLSILRGG